MKLKAMAVIAVIVAGLGSSAHAALTYNWVPVNITPAAIADDPVLATMQSWSLMITNTDGDWASAGMRLILQPGNFFYKHALGGNTRPNPIFFPVAPALEFTTYVSAAADNGSNSATLVLGGYPETDPASLGDAGATLPGQLSFSWGDLITTPPGTYEILRITFPQGVLPDGFGETSQVNPLQTIEIIVPEPSALAGVIALAGMMAARQRRRAARA